MHVRSLENRSFLLLVVLVTLALLWVLQGFLLPVFWAVVLAIVFAPVFHWFRARLGGRGAPAALLTLLVIFLLLVVPLVAIGFAVTNEAVGLYDQIASGELSINERIQEVEAMLPRLSERAGQLGVDLDRVREGVESFAVTAGRGLAGRLVDVGQYALGFVLLLVVTFYTLFFFLKDGEDLIQMLVRALPLGDPREKMIMSRFASVTRATVKGSFIVAMVQGAIGGIAFYFLGLGSPVLWGVLMALLSLIPAVGATIVWGPAAIFLLATGDVTKGIILIAIGAGGIGLIDNALRPILVGRDAGMPDYVILLSTLGGIAAFGISGLVIGPVIAGLFLSVWTIFADEFGGLDSSDPNALIGVYGGAPAPLAHPAAEPDPAASLAAARAHGDAGLVEDAEELPDADGVAAA